MSDIAQRIDAVIKAYLAPSLRELGFKKKARNFRRRVADATQVINVQASSSNLGSEGRFTLNLGLYFPAAANFVGRYKELDEPTEPDCPMRRRIGGLMPSRLDKWWAVTPTTDIDALSRSVTDTLVCYGMPWMQHLSSLQNAAADEHPHDGPIVKAALLLAAGNRAVAIELMTRGLEHSDPALAGWFAFAVAAGLEDEYRAARAAAKASADH